MNAAKVQAIRHVAAIDCGSAEIRASVAEIRGRELAILEDVSFPIDFSDAFHGGRLSHRTLREAVRIFGLILETVKGYGVTEIRAVATSALREAANADVLLEWIRQEHGLAVEVIEGSEEARVYFRALARVMEQEERDFARDTLLLDIGSGHTTVALIRRGRLVYSLDDHFSTLRTLEHLESLRDSLDLVSAIDRYCQGAARIMVGRLPRMSRPQLMMTGGEVRYLVDLLHGEGEERLRQVEAGELDAWCQRMLGLTPVERATACQSDVDRADELLPVAGLMRYLSRDLECPITVPRLRLRDGLLADFLPDTRRSHHFSRQDLLAIARQMAARYGMSLPYAENIADLARQIFHQTTHLHRLGERELTLLEFAALVHDLGAMVNVRSRHKHTWYIITSADIPGLSAREKTLVALVARYHRRSPPMPSHLDFQALPREDRLLVSTLASILRLAYALDVERTQRIRSVRVEQIENTLILHVDRRQLALERWSVADKAGMFRDLFGLEVVLAARPEG